MPPRKPRAGEPEKVEAPASSDREPPGPPSDVVTSYEDLPHDLFGEPDAPPPGVTDAGPTPGPEARDADATPPTPAAPSRAASGEPPPRARPAPPAGETAREGAGRADAGGDDGDDAAIAMVQSLFPGRIVGLEPDEREDDEGPDDGASDLDLEAGAEDDGGGDGDPDVAGDGARGRSG